MTNDPRISYLTLKYPRNGRNPLKQLILKPKRDLHVFILNLKIQISIK